MRRRNGRFYKRCRRLQGCGAICLEFCFLVSLERDAESAEALCRGGKLASQHSASYKLFAFFCSSPPHFASFPVACRQLWAAVKNTNGGACRGCVLGLAGGHGHAASLPRRHELTKERKGERVREMRDEERERDRQRLVFWWGTASLPMLWFS